VAHSSYKARCNDPQSKRDKAQAKQRQAKQRQAKQHRAKASTDNIYDISTQVNERTSTTTTKQCRLLPQSPQPGELNDVATGTTMETTKTTGLEAQRGFEL